ncbi:MAG TPA: hypothetical protein PLO50_07505, partial [Nitrospira sp.]|nr:hypothetical protein [Nitrospira sp.]
MMTVSLERLQLEARRAAGWTTTVLGFTIPIWVVADSILVVLLLVCWVAGGEWKERLRRITTNPVAVSVLLLFGWLLLGTLWGGGSVQERALGIKKYADLLIIPVLISMAMTVQERNRALVAFAAALLVTLFLSFSLSMGGSLPLGEPTACSPLNSCVFKKHTTHNVMMAFGALLFAVFSWKSQDRWMGWGWGGAAVLAVSNVLFMVQGRTGYVVFAGLAFPVGAMHAQD